MRSHIDFETIEANMEGLTASFRNAKPFPHVAIDGFLKKESLDELISKLPPPDATRRSSDYIFAKNKFENPTFSSAADIFRELREELLSERFARIISNIYGKPLFVDPSFLGGGLHQGGEGSYLDMHADFNRHPARQEWLRELNILLYLNRDYQEEWGGHLELLNSKTQEKGRVAPQENRMVFMYTSDHTLHGYKKISFPPGRYRTSIAAYAYSQDLDFKGTPARSTLWKPDDAGVGKSLLAATMPSLVKVKNSLFGSSTERRASKVTKE